MYLYLYIEYSIIDTYIEVKCIGCHIFFNELLWNVISVDYSDYKLTINMDYKFGTLFPGQSSRSITHKHIKVLRIVYIVFDSDSQLSWFFLNIIEILVGWDVWKTLTTFGDVYEVKKFCFTASK